MQLRAKTKRGKRNPRPRATAHGAKVDARALESTVGHLTRVVQVRLFQLYYERLGHLRVSPGAFAVLTAIRSNPGIQHRTLAETVAAHGPNITKLIDKLVRAGWVERRASQNDKRATGHYLTTEGRAKADVLFKAGLAHDRFATSSLSEAERGALLRLLAKLNRDLSAKSRQPTS